MHKESLKKYFRGSCKFPQAHKKVCDKNEGRKKQEKQDTHIKVFLMEGSGL